MLKPVYVDGLGDSFGVDKCGDEINADGWIGDKIPK